MNLPRYKRSPVAFFWLILKPYRFYYLLIQLTFPLIFGIGPILVLHYLTQLVDLIIQGDIFGHWQLLLLPLGFLFLYDWVLILSALLHDYLLRSVMSNSKVKIIQLVYQITQSYPYGYFSKKPLGELQHQISQLSSSWERFHEGLSYRVMLPALTLLAALGMLFLTSGHLALLAIVFTAIFFFSMLHLYLSPKRSQLLKKETKAEEGVMAYITDVFRQMESVFAFRSHRREEQQLKEKTTNELQPAIQQVYKWEFVKVLWGGVLYVIITYTLLGYVTYLAYQKNISATTYLKLALLIYEILRVLWSLTHAVSDLIRDLRKTKNYLQIIQGTPRPFINNKNYSLAKKTINKEKIIALRSITFGHKKTPLFENFSLAIAKGEKVAIVGSSGAGKSSLIKLIMRYFTISDGVIEIEGVPLTDYSEQDLADKIVLIPQSAGLFNRTLLENIRYGKPNATLEEVRLAAKKAQIDDFICSLPNQYETKVGENGATLSGGERQRIAIARAILQDPPILILDEATAALDTATEKKIQQSLEPLFANRSKTMIIIAHRLPTIKSADYIIVLEQGKIIEEGKHTTLLAQQGAYSKLWKAQYEMSS